MLAPHLGRRGQRRLAAPGGTRNLDAYQAYLIAQQHAQGIKTAGLVKSLELYRQAIALDADYALAHSGMAESYRRMVFGADGEPAVVMREARRHADRAVELDPELAEAHAGVGWNRFWGDWDWSGAAAAFEHALGLNASESNAHFGYSQLLETLGRRPEAIVHLRRARENDPLSLILLTLESGTLLGAGQREQAQERLQRVFVIEPDFWVAHMVQAGFQRVDGRTAEAIHSLETADRLSDGSSQPAAALGSLLARTGNPAGARALLVRLQAQGQSRYVPPTSAGLIHAALGEKAQAMEALERGLAVRDARMTLVSHDSRWKLVHDDPRYAAVLRRMNLA